MCSNSITGRLLLVCVYLQSYLSVFSLLLLSMTGDIVLQLGWMQHLLIFRFLCKMTTILGRVAKNDMEIFSS
jgi:hypothetical protein